MTSWFRYRNDRTSIQGLRIWVKGLLDEFGDPVIEGATLWMTAPGEFETQQVGSLACTESGSAFFEIVVDSRFDDPAEALPLGVPSLLSFERALIEVRIPDAAGEDVPALRGRILDFRYRDIVLGEGPPGTRGRTAPTQAYSLHELFQLLCSSFPGVRLQHLCSCASGNPIA